jgi:predicted ABC-type ATPase
MPGLFIITGPNGAGKSTVGYTYLPEKIQRNYTVFDGDKLSMQKRKELLSSIKSLKEARNMADEWVEEYFRKQVSTAIKSKDHFAYEGHFRDPSTLNIPKKFKKNGYSVSLIFMGLTDPDLSELRVLDRARHGGHFVPLYEIQSNFYGNLIMLNKNFRLFDELLIIDTSLSLEHKILLHIRNSKIISYTQSVHLPVWFIKFLPEVLKLIIAEETKKQRKKKS